MRISKRKIDFVKYGGRHTVHTYNNWPYRYKPVKRYTSKDTVYELDNECVYIQLPDIPKYMIVERCGKMIKYYYSNIKIKSIKALST